MHPCDTSPKSCIADTVFPTTMSRCKTECRCSCKYIRNHTAQSRTLTRSELGREAESWRDVDSTAP